jgi:two-component system response regulator AtoC
MENRIIAVDDDRDFLEILGMHLVDFGYRDFRVEEDPLKAAALFHKGEAFDLALIDMHMPELDGMALLDLIKTNSPTTECIMVTAVNDARVAVECLRKGAYDYLVKPIPREELRIAIERALERKRLLDIVELSKKSRLPELKNPAVFQGIITRSASVQRILKEAELHAATTVPVLITGESGTGKELLAHAIHDASPRARFAFTPVNMASVNANLFDAEFFGHTRGAFTGAGQERIGYLEHTHRGTLFLDEIGILPLELQGKLLRVLQDGEFVKLGSNQRQKADVRFIAATNEDLDKLMARKLFRKDLYYRIRGGWLHLPPLRERPEDILLLANHFMRRFSETADDAAIEPDAAALLAAYSYPGNIRELQSIVRSALNLAQGRPIAARFLPPTLQQLKGQGSNGGRPALPLETVVKGHILSVYRQTGENKSRTARVLGIGLNTLRRKLSAYGIR